MPTSTPLRTIVEPSGWNDAISDTDGAQLILAGPGTGKTDFLARRVAHLLSSGVPARQVLVLTFSRRAASELEDRITALLDRPVSGATASTFHSFAHRLIETQRHRAGLPMPILLTGPEQVRLVGRLLSGDDPDLWPGPFRPLLGSSTLAEEVADFMMRCQERLLSPDRLAELASGRDDWRALPGFLRRYTAALAEEGKIDYGGLIAQAVDATAVNATAVVETHQPGFDYVLVDEYQDTSPAQARLAEMAAPGGNLTVAADPHQSIYSFRGADIGNVARFTERMEASGKPVETLVLGRSFRTPASILSSARRLVAPNPGSLIDMEPADHTGTVEAYTFDQRSAEAEWIASEVERLHIIEGVPLAAIAVLVRSTRHLLPELSRALDRRHVPHDRPDRRLVDHPAIRLVSDVVEAALTPAGSADHERAVRRLLLGPAVGLPLSQERELWRKRQRTGLDWPELLNSQLPELSGLADLVADSEWATGQPAVDGFWHLWDRLPGLESLVSDPGRAAFRTAWSTFARMLERQAERDSSLSLADSLAATATGDFEASPQLRHTREDSDRLVVTTLHQAKGTEFDIVFIADATEGVFPDNRKVRSLLQPQLLSASLSNPRSRLQEERRLAYTATTRARRRVIWTATTAGIDEGERRPSRFMLAATGRDSFEGITAPAPFQSDEFAPLTLTAAEATLRRLLVDPAIGPVDRLAALATLTSHPDWDPLSFAGVPEPGPDTGVVRHPFRLSPSQATLYEQCPRRYALERRLQAVNVESPYLHFGSIVHEVLELTELQAQEEGRGHGDLAGAIDNLERVWPRYRPFGPPPLDEAWKRRAGELLDQMYGNWPGRDGETALALETELDLTIDGVDWIGRADRVERTPEGSKIVDYKTSRTPPTLKDAGSSLQLGYYVLAASERPDLVEEGPVAGAELWYPLARGKRKVFPFDMSNLESARESLRAVTEGIRQESWPTRIGAHCERCPFRGVCPAWPDGREALG